VVASSDVNISASVGAVVRNSIAAAVMDPMTAISPVGSVPADPVVEALPTASAAGAMVPISLQSATAPNAAESSLTLLSGASPAAPLASAVSSVMLAATRRELGGPTTRNVPSVLVAAESSLVRTVARSAAAIPAANLQAATLLAAATTADPIAGFFEQIGAFVGQIVSGITQAISQFISAIVNIFVPHSTTAAIVATITLNEPAQAPWPGLLAVSPSSGRLYAPLTQYGGVAVVDINPSSPTVNAVTSTIGANNGIWAFADAAITSDGRRLFLLDGNEDALLTLDPTNPQPAYTSINFSYWPRAFAINADGTRAYVTYTTNSGSKVDVINTTTRAVIGTVALVGDPNPDYSLPDGYQLDWYFPDHIALSPNGTRAYVIASNGLGSKVLVVDTSTFSTVASVRLGTDPLDLVASPDGKLVYVANLNSNSVSVIDTATNTVTSTINTRFPEHVAISPDGKKLFVSNWITTSSSYATTSTISVIDTTTKLVTATIPVNGTVQDLAVTGERLYITATGPIGTTETPTRILVVAV